MSGSVMQTTSPDFQFSSRVSHPLFAADCWPGPFAPHAADLQCLSPPLSGKCWTRLDLAFLAAGVPRQGRCQSRIALRLWPCPLSILWVQRQVYRVSQAFACGSPEVAHCIAGQNEHSGYASSLMAPLPLPAHVPSSVSAHIV